MIKMAKFTKDNFGNDQMVVGLKDNKNGFATGYIEIGNKAYRVQISDAKKDGISYWLSFTKVQKKEDIKKKFF